MIVIKDDGVYSWRGYKFKLGEQYHRGKEPPHYPVPAIPVRVGYQPACYIQQEYPSAYWWIASRTLLWSCFEKHGLVIERA